MMPDVKSIPQPISYFEESKPTDTPETKAITDENLNAVTGEKLHRNSPIPVKLFKQEK
jgi:hypothetical protein